MSKLLSFATLFSFMLCSVIASMFVSVHSVSAAWCNENSNTTGPMNLNPVDKSKPVFVRRVPNAELYTVGENINDQISLVHLYGATGYEWGYGYGTLMKTEMVATLNGFWNYVADEIIGIVNGTATKDHLYIPKWFLEDVANFGLDVALGIQNDFAKPYMLPSWYDEMRGMADAIHPDNTTAAGLLYKKIVDVHMVAELTKGRCSFYGMTGAATKGGKTLQLRALDWNMGTGIQDHPIVVIYHPKSPELGHPFANIGWAGVVMTLSGMSSARLGISEIGISYPDSTFGDEVPYGIPFTFLERYLIQFAKNITDGIDIINNANRTCRLVLGMADGNLNKSVLVQYSHSIVRFFNYTDLEPLEWYHQRIKDIVYLAMDWSCPYYQNLMQNQLRTLYGEITPELSIMNITAPVQTGSLHCCVYDLTDQEIFVANARGSQDDPSGPEDAYQRQFVNIQVGKLWNKPYGVN